MIVVLTTLFVAVYLPWHLKDKKAKKAALPQ